MSVWDSAAFIYFELTFDSNLLLIGNADLGLLYLLSDF